MSRDWRYAGENGCARLLNPISDVQFRGMEGKRKDCSSISIEPLTLLRDRLDFRLLENGGFGVEEPQNTKKESFKEWGLYLLRLQIWEYFFAFVIRQFLVQMIIGWPFFFKFLLVYTFFNYYWNFSFGNLFL